MDWYDYPGQYCAGWLRDAIDKNAFIVEFDVNSVKGGVLRRFLSKKTYFVKNKTSHATPSTYRPQFYLRRSGFTAFFSAF